MLRKVKKYPVFRHAAIQWLIKHKSGITDVENMRVSLHNIIGTKRATMNSISDHLIWPTKSQESNNAQAADATIYDQKKSNSN